MGLQQAGEGAGQNGGSQGCAGGAGVGSLHIGRDGGHSLAEGQHLRFHRSLDGEPVGCCTLFLGTQIAGLYNIGTAPHVQRRGIGTALTAVPMRYAAERGYEVNGAETVRMIDIEDEMSKKSEEFKESGSELYHKV